VPYIKKIFFLIVAVTLVSCGDNPSVSTSDKSVEELRKEMAADRVELIFFHNHERCLTCTNMEKLTKEVVDTFFGQQVKEGKVVLIIVDIEDRKNRAIIDDYRVVWTSLYINRWRGGTESRHNMTEFAFLNVDSSPDRFKEGIRQKVEELL